MKSSQNETLAIGNVLDSGPGMTALEEGMTALSNTAFEALLPIQLDPDAQVTKDYDQVFYPRRKPVKGSIVTRTMYPALVNHLASLSAHINAVFNVGRMLVREAEDMASMSPELKMTRTTNYVTALRKKAADNSLISGAAKVYLESVSSGKAHIIRPSDRYKNGYDILYSGLPAYRGTKGTAISVPVHANGVEHVFSDSTRSWEYKNTMRGDTGVLNTNALAQGSLAMCRTMLTELFGDASVGTLASLHERKMHMLPLDTDFSKMSAAAVAKMKGHGVDLRALADMPKLEGSIARGLGQYFSILLVCEANHHAVMSRIKDAAISPAGLDLNEDAPVLQPVIGLSIVMHLPAELVSFITQTKQSDQVPLTALNTWASVWSRALMRPPKAKSKKGERVTVLGAPRYVLSASSTSSLIERRKQLGFFTEEGRTNEDDLYVSNSGTLHFCPKSTELAMENARNYEALMEDALKVSFNAGSPLNASQQGETNPVFSLASPEYKENIAKLKGSLKKYAGSLQTYSWDYNCILASSKSDPDKLEAINLAGAARPDELSLADYLRRPFANSMIKLFPDARISEGDEGADEEEANPNPNQKGKAAKPQSKPATEETFGKGGTAVPMLRSSVFINAKRMYQSLLHEKAVPSLQELVNLSAKALEITKLDDEKVAPYEKNLFNGILTADLKVAPTLGEGASPMRQVDAIWTLLERALRDASGYPGSNLARHCYATGENVDENDHFMNAEHFTLAEFKNVFRYFGGQIFYQMMNALAHLDRKKIMMVSIDNPEPRVNFRKVVEEVMPLAVIMSKYIPQSEAIYAKADELAERNTKNTSIGPDEIKVPGSKAPENGKPGMQMFPHQVEVHQYLRNKPRFAVLDVAPGGGKTIAVLSDIACLVRDKQITTPLIVCPNGLVRNWVEDMHKITQGKWNVIPITTATYKTWGDERLTKMIKNKPRNTIVVVGLSVLQLQRYPVVIGNHVEKVSGTLEFMKKFGFDYVAVDESHRVKNVRTATHRAVKQLATMSSVKYIRLATGTLISNTLTDVIGQAAMFSSQIFRTVEEYKKENSEWITLGDKEVYTFRKDTPQRAREQLARHAAVITFKRKEWAFMLPMPKEKFIAVAMQKDDSELGGAHQLMYDTVLSTVIEDLQKDKEVMKVLRGGSTDTEGEDDEEEAEENDDADEADGLKDTLNGLLAGGKPDNMDDATMAELEMMLKPYLQRLEMLLTDPLGDEWGEKYFKGLKQNDFIPNKVLKIIDRIKLNFMDFPWVENKVYAKGGKNDKDEDYDDICDHEGKRYVLKPDPEADPYDRAAYYAPYKSKLPPSKDPKRWKEESRGKVIVFCRYTRSVNAIMRALEQKEPALAKLAVRFHGEIKEKWANLDAFKATPIDRNKGVQILIANEQAISEGHNLQMASRLIRVESPWAPGELDQSAARIFRPDPTGKFSRENVYLDWILTNGSMEVAKMGRLISKMVQKAQFDEANNPLYEDINEYQLPPISMGLDTIRATPLLSDISDYTSAYAELARIQGAEFREMRQTRRSTMFDIEPEPMFDDNKIIDQTPYVPNMKVPDRHNFGLIPLPEYLQDTENEEVKQILLDPKLLEGQYAHTEFGNGVITKVSFGKVDKDNPNAPRRISRVEVTLAGSGEKYEGAPGMIHIATNLTAETIKNFQVPKVVTKKDKERAEKLRAIAEKKAAAEEKKRKAQAKKEKERLAKLKEIEKLAAKGKVSGAKKPAKPAPVIEEPDEEEDNNRATVYPVMYNGFLALEVDVEDDNIDLKHYGFKRSGDYAYVGIPDFATFEAVMKAITKKFMVPKPILKRLQSLEDTFISGRGRKFAVEQAPIGEFRNFYKMNHTLAKKDEETGKVELKIYPVILNGKLMLTVDIPTNPAIRKFLDKVIPNAPKAKFKHADGIDVQFFTKKSDMSKKVKELQKAGFEIVNIDEFTEELKALNIKAAKA